MNRFDISLIQVHLRRGSHRKLDIVLRRVRRQQPETPPAGRNEFSKWLERKSGGWAIAATPIAPKAARHPRDRRRERTVK